MSARPQFFNLEGPAKHATQLISTSFFPAYSHPVDIHKADAELKALRRQDVNLVELPGPDLGSQLQKR